MEKLTKQMLIDRYHIKEVRSNGPHIIIVLERIIPFFSRNGRIALTDYSKEPRIYKGVKKLPRTSIPVYRIAYVWKHGEVNKSDYVIYDPVKNELVAVNRSIYHREHNTLKRRK